MAGFDLLKVRPTPGFLLPIPCLEVSHPDDQKALVPISTWVEIDLTGGGDA